MILGTLRILPPPGRRVEVLQILRSIQGPVAAQPGCGSCRIYEEEGPEAAIVLLEQWESKAALEAHLRSDAYRRILGALELSSAPPEVRFDSVTESEGMELIERIRSPGRTTHRGRRGGEDDAGPTATRRLDVTVPEGEKKR
jgi:quinol monooxygenase YgiN